MSIKDLAWRLWGSFYRSRDTNRNNEGKGIWQRYQDLHALELEEQTKPYIDNFELLNRHPSFVLDKFLGYFEALLGANQVFETASLKRKFVRYGYQLMQNKGKALNYIVMFNWLGIKAEVVEVSNSGGFDNGTFDVGTFDVSGGATGEFDIILYVPNTVVQDSDFLALANRIIEFNRPIHARFRNLEILPLRIFDRTFDNTFG
jgi:hypothetical protein